MDRKRSWFSRAVCFCAFVAAVVSAFGVSALRAEVGDPIAKFVAPDAAYTDFLGNSVGIDGTTAIVGAQRKADVAGSAYIFDAQTGSNIFKLTSGEQTTGERFGSAVGISGTTAIVGASSKDDWMGAAYLFDFEVGGSCECRRLNPIGLTTGGLFGNAVGISESTAIVGAWYEDDDEKENMGSAYLFGVETGAQRFKLTPDDGEASDGFGFSVATHGNIAIVGAMLDDLPYKSDAGSAYLFNVTTGERIAKLTAPDAVGDGHFGTSVAIYGTTAIVGAKGHNAAYLFNASTGGFITKLTADDGAAYDHFGCSVGISENTVIVGAESDDDNGSNSGSAYLFNTSGNQIDKLTPNNGTSGDYFGRAAAITDGFAVVGATNEHNAGYDYTGSAYTFEAPESGDIPPVDVTDYKQDGGDWGDDPYDGLQKTMAKKGCAVTSLAMALEYAGIDIDPGTLNTLMQEEGGYSGSSVHWSDATRIAANNADKPEIHFHYEKSSDPNDLDNQLSTGNPVIVRVPNGTYVDPKDGKTKTKTHFVVVTGKEDGQYTISDPGYSDRTTLDAYGNQFETRGYVEDPLDVSELDISVSTDLLAAGAGSGILIYVKDPQGNTTYCDSFGNIHEDIPQSVLFVDYVSDIDSDDPPEDINQMVSIFHPELGEYYVKVYCPDGTDTPFELTMTVYAADGSEMRRDVQTGNLASGTWEDCTFAYTPEPTTLSLLCVTALMMCKRRRRQAA